VTEPEVFVSGSASDIGGMLAALSHLNQFEIRAASAPGISGIVQVGRDGLWSHAADIMKMADSVEAHFVWTVQERFKLTIHSTPRGIEEFVDSLSEVTRAGHVHES
jgi:hypothetical protein